MRKHYFVIPKLLAYGLVCYMLLTSQTSCVTHKTMVYFQADSLDNTVDSIRQTYVPTIQKNDMLSISVGSLNMEANEIFNNVSHRNSVADQSSLGISSSQPNGHLVFSDGSIEMPLIGKVKVVNLEVQQAADTLRKRLTKYLKAPSVEIHITNFKVSVLGEVNRPAIYNIPDGKITLPEVLSLAGDLTVYGRRDNIMIVRESEGKRTYKRVDMTSKAIFNSPYYYLHKGDLVYVEPVKAKEAHVDRTYQVLPLVLSGLTTLSVIAFRFL
jgi:polysaccharide biosynthesis/export protein